MQNTCPYLFHLKARALELTMKPCGPSVTMSADMVSKSGVAVCTIAPKMSVKSSPSVAWLLGGSSPAEKNRLLMVIKQFDFWNQHYAYVVRFPLFGKGTLLSIGNYFWYFCKYFHFPIEIIPKKNGYLYNSCNSRNKL